MASPAKSEPASWPLRHIGIRHLSLNLYNTFVSACSRRVTQCRLQRSLTQRSCSKSRSSEYVVTKARIWTVLTLDTI